MPKTHRKLRKCSPFFLFPFTLFLTLLLSLPWVSAQETPKPQPWLIDGIVAALDDGYDKVKRDALYQLTRYEPEDLKAVVKKPEDLAKKVAGILKDEQVDSDVRSRAALTLGNFGEAAKSSIPDILNILQDEQVDSWIRSSAAYALSNFGETAKSHIPEILNFLKDEQVDSNIRGGAAEALGNFGEAAKSHIPEILNFLQDEQVDSNIRGVAAEALGNFGEAAESHIPEILNILKDEQVDSLVRGGAAVALGNFGEAAKSSIPEILNILKDEQVDSLVRGGAAVALGNFGEAAKSSIPEILNILQDEQVNLSVRESAAVALGNFGEAAKSSIPEILNILQDEQVNLSVRESAAYALSNLGEAAESHILEILNILQDEQVNLSVRKSAAVVLGNFGEAAKSHIPEILNILQDEQVDSFVRRSAAEALGNFGEATKSHIPEILNILKDEQVNSSVRGSAAEALSNFGEATKSHIPEILNFLKDEQVDSFVRGSAALALGNFGEAAKSHIPEILNFLKDEQVDLYLRRHAAALALGKIRRLELNEVVVILDRIYEPKESDFEFWRFLTYFLGGGTDEVKTLLKWMGNPSQETIDAQSKLKYKEAKKTLEVFRDAWIGTQGLQRLQIDLANQIAKVTSRVPWKSQDITLLQTHYNNLKKSEYHQADTVKSAINKLEFWQWLLKARNTILIHITFWLALIFAYPKFPQVQAIFFWNPWVRKILGVGYVGFLLTWIPYLRRKLFEPFKPSLQADAGLDTFQHLAYFPQSQVKIPGSGDIKPITEALPSIQGQIVLEGDSGWGKSMFLRHLVANSQQIIVYLPAQKCSQGVIEAIQAKLHGQAQDAAFLKNLIYSGAIDICIDGLNEITADTRAKITHFVERYFRGNIIMTTQPLEWTPPSTAKTYYLQPLEPQQIQEFLISRQDRFPQDAKVQGENYEKACTAYLTDIIKLGELRKLRKLREKNYLNLQQPKEELEAAQRILSNPMDLTLISLMLSQGKTPDLFHLQEQQYNQMAEEFLKEWRYEFPLKKFSQAVYQMRLNDQKALPAADFYQELLSLEDEKYKMAVSRQWTDREGKSKKEWYFRHDKIMDFFLVQNFLGDSEEVENRLIDHMNDPRFRGVYFLLATLLPLTAAQELREQLIQYAADTKDHTVSDTFVQILRSRKAVS
ncbi:MAG: HEAT repeat domain-containing protein [Symploca sp. SIO1C2]|nr:HEAT repeat domain-containing protein [Symploca sp. SIO1C2]